MKASELIMRLVQLLAMHGDRVVLADFYEQDKVDAVRYDQRSGMIILE